MSWDEALFSVVWHGAQRAFQAPTRPEVLARRVDVEPERGRLELLARLLAGSPLTVTLTDEVGGVQGDVISLPRQFDFAPSLELNRAAMVVRVAWACATRALGLVRTPATHPTLATALAAPAIRRRVLDDAPALGDVLPALERAALAQRLPPAVGDARAEALEATLRLALGATPDSALPDGAWVWATAAHAGSPRSLPPARKAWRSPVHQAVPLWGELLVAAAPALSATPPTGQDPPVALGATARNKKTVTALERVQEPDSPLHENPLVHSFEKVHTLETYKGGSKRIDGDDELAAHQRALDELDLRQVMRSHQRARSVYQADVLLSGTVGELADEDARTVERTYDEWDESQRAYRRKWCRLTSRVVAIGARGDARAALRDVRARLAATTTKLRAIFEQLDAERAWRLRQRHGPDVDVDAVVARYGSLRAGHCSEDRLYAQRRRHSRDTAVLLLVDTSLSTDAWVANRRVLDVEKEAVIAVGDALDGLFDDVAVAAFCSQSRRDCRYAVAKGFDESWQAGTERVMSLEPAGFTRIGPALRHATAELLTRGARQKLLLLISDGKPSDVDRYEGRYGVADVHRAVRDAEACGVVTHALAVDPSAKAWLPSMFGHGRASVMNQPHELVTALASVVATGLRR